MEFHNTVMFLLLLHAVPVLYHPEILNINIEQEAQDMGRKYTPQERQFLDYFHSIDKHAIEKILSEYRSTGPIGYSSSLILSRILKVKERISSDRELSDKLAKNPIYRYAVGISANEVPAHNTFNTLRQRLCPEGFARIHRHFVMQAFHKVWCWLQCQGNTTVSLWTSDPTQRNRIQSAAYQVYLLLWL